MAKIINGEVQLHAQVDGKEIVITESSVRIDLQLADEEDIDCLPNSIIFEQLALMGLGKGFSGKVTPLFQTMVIQNLSELGEGSAMPTDPYHTPTILQPLSQPQKIHKPRKPKRKDTQVPQPRDPTECVIDEAVHKELGDSLVRAATTASSLEVEQDSGNITKTQSKATPNKSSSQGTDLGGGPRGNTLQSDEDRLKLDELMALCTTLQNSVLDLEKTMTTKRNQIDSLKRRVKKLEKRNRSRTHKLKRLYKVGLSVRVESSGDEESLGEDASKQERRIDAIDADEDITLVNDADNEMFDVDVLGSEEMFVAGKNENVVEEVVEAQIDADHQLAKKMQAQEQEELSDADKATLFQQLLEKRRNHFAAKRAEKKRNKPPTKAQQRKIMVNTFEDFRTELVEGKEKREGTELEQEITKKKRVEDDKEKAELKQLMETILDE
nr:hypothetical protein [Tanacetum cinerariifolium]